MDRMSWVGRLLAEPFLDLFRKEEADAQKLKTDENELRPRREGSDESEKSDEKENGTDYFLHDLHSVSFPTASLTFR